MDRTTWETTRSTAVEQLARLEERRGEQRDQPMRDGLFAQELARIKALLRDMDEQEEAVLARAEIQANRPDDCRCLGTGGLGMLQAVMSDGLTLFDGYCGCPEGAALSEAAAWATEGVDAEDRVEREREEQERKTARERELLLRSGIDQRYASCTFASFREILLARHALRQDMDAALRMMEESYTKGTMLRGDYIWGEPGHGKTSLQVSAMRALIGLGRTCLFIHYGDLLERLRLAYGRRDGSGDELLERLRLVPALFLDDLGMVQASRHEAGRITNLIASRHSAGKRLLTGFTSNHTMRDISILLTNGDDPVSAKRLEGRLREMCDEIRLRTIDLRTGLREHVPS